MGHRGILAPEVPTLGPAWTPQRRRDGHPGAPAGQVPLPAPAHCQQRAPGNVFVEQMDRACVGGPVWPAGRSPQPSRRGPARHMGDLGGEVLSRPRPLPEPRCILRGTRRGARPPAALLGSGPGALHAHVGTRGLPRAGHVLISPLSWEFCLKANKPKKSSFCPGFLVPPGVWPPLPEASGPHGGHPAPVRAAVLARFGQRGRDGAGPRSAARPSDLEGRQREGARAAHFLSSGFPAAKQMGGTPLPSAFPGDGGVPGEPGEGRPGVGGPTLSWGGGAPSRHLDRKMPQSHGVCIGATGWLRGRRREPVWGLGRPLGVGGVRWRCRRVQSTPFRTRAPAPPAPCGCRAQMLSALLFWLSE